MDMPPLPFAPTRAAGLARLAAFLPRAGVDYARNRNLDLAGQPHVSALSPWLRHRLVSEEEVIKAAVDRHGASPAEKFVSEVLWRSYWKGFLEMRPGLWAGYQAGVRRGLDRVAAEAGLRQQWQHACEGRTGIDGFDHWARALVATGWLHNHARMWFASIWIFTLRLPWELGADFFLRHLLDGDPASNTLSWRWVAGLHTPGKTFLATAENIARNTGGRFMPLGLATVAAPVEGMANPAAGACPRGDWADPALRTVVLAHDDDLATDAGPAVSAAVLSSGNGRSPGTVAPGVRAFARAAGEDWLAQQAVPAGGVMEEVAEVVAWAVASGAQQVVTPFAPVGPVAALLDRLDAALAAQGIRLARVIRPWDARLWPHATHGFYRFRAAVGAV